MLYKSLITAVLVVFSAGTVQAAPRITMESLDKALEGIQSTYKTVGDLTANFTQKTFVAILEKNVVNRGVLSWKKPGMFFVDYTGTEPKQYISNNKTMWVYVPGDTQVEIYKVSAKTISKEALEFMRGFGNIKKNFKITSWKKQGDNVDLTLVPLFQGAPYSQLKCNFQGDNLLHRVTIYNITGNVSTYDFSNIRINNGLPDDLFKFKKPKGVKEVAIR